MLQFYPFIRRFFLFKKALSKFTKKGNTISQVELIILYCILLVDGSQKYITITPVYKTLKQVNRSINHGYLYIHLYELVNKGYITHDTSGRFQKFRLTIKAINLFNDFEKLYKKERWNR